MGAYAKHRPDNEKQDKCDHVVQKDRKNKRPKILAELVPRPAECLADAEPRPGRRTVARCSRIAGRGSVARWRRVAGGRPVAGLGRRPVAGRWRGGAVPRRWSVAGLRLPWRWSVPGRRTVAGGGRVIARIRVTPVRVVWIARVLRRLAHGRSCLVDGELSGRALSRT